MEIRNVIYKNFLKFRPFYIYFLISRLVILWLQKTCPVIFWMKISKRPMIYGAEKSHRHRCLSARPVRINFAPSLNTAAGGDPRTNW